MGNGCATESFRFPTTNGLELQGYYRQASGDSRGTVLMIHGCTEHSGRYEEVAVLLSGVGFAVLQLDLRGHGDSDGRRLMVRTFGDYMDDVVACWEHKREELRDGPLFLCGFSMGGTVATMLVLERRLTVKGLVLCSPLLKLGRGFSRLKVLLTKWVGPLLPWIPVASLDAQMFSHDETAVAGYLNDPKVHHGGIPFCFGVATIDAIARIERKEHLLDLPLLVLHGDADTITDPQGSQRLFDKAKSTHKDLKRYDLLYHDLMHENDADKEQVQADLLKGLTAM